MNLSFVFVFLIKRSLCRRLRVVYPYGEVSVKASGGAAVLSWIDEGQRPECVLEQFAGKGVCPFAAQSHTHAQDPLQVPQVFQQLLAIHTGYLNTHTHTQSQVIKWRVVS